MYCRQGKIVNRERELILLTKVKIKATVLGMTNCNSIIFDHNTDTKTKGTTTKSIVIIKYYSINGFKA